MQSNKARLDRFISAKTGICRGDLRLILAQKRVRVDGEVVTTMNYVVNQFSRIELDDQLLQDKQPRYLMLNKPVGVVSATQDAQHKTVVDLLDPALREDLHIVGRLDLNSSGLVLLTNDGEWSRCLMAPEAKVAKVYEVQVEQPISDDCIRAFAEGMYFAFEDLTTRPARLEKMNDTLAKVTLTEGRYHQIKRMFGRFRNKVVALHRVSVGPIRLDGALAPGESRALTTDEVNCLNG
ncbi:MAG: 16S rRNA pseudouridine(516) synthase [Hahellaceae bacterium]|nr:16S rRNA pseudouridine(516) synthase [Hahellaceae bacterium]MCP5170174.1 16S rRNA pseudouridine(516) synthase [Hahellaceae bacterium]